MFCSERGSLTNPLCHVTGHSERMYFYVGAMMSYSLVHKGQAPNFLSSLTYRMLSQGMDVEVDSRDITDVELRAAVEKVCEGYFQHKIG